MPRPTAILAVAALLAAMPASATPAAAPATAPRVGIASLDQLPKPLPLPYVEGRDAKAAIAAARTRAARAHKRLLIDMGGNWCLDCRLLAGVMELPAMRGFVARHYEVVTVDVGRFDRNMDIPARYGITGRLAGVPAVFVVDPRTDRVVNAGHETATADARTMSLQALADWLARWVG